jgi:Bromodomain extra-terminal - transcription regulation
MKYTSKQKKNLLERINNLSATEHEEIFNIIHKISLSQPDVNFTSNKNGIFFNLSTLNDTIIEEIDKFVNFCHSNKIDLDEYDKRLNECKVNANIINLDLETIVEKPSDGKQQSALPICDWTSLNLDTAVDNKSAQKIVTFIEKLYSDKTGKKKINVKFHNAKKKYGKKVVTDSKFEYELLGDLHQEEFLLKA